MKRFVILHSFTIILLRNVQQIHCCNDGFYLNESGFCERCPDNCIFCASEKYCLSCKYGYAGTTCDFFCSQCLPGTSCDKLTHFCLHACKDGLSGPLCDIKCDEKCLSCNRTDPQLCMTCDTGRYGAGCESCPVSCAKNTCDQQGFCILGCKQGNWGQMCEKDCGEHCISKSCLRENGTCTDECEDGSAGSNFNKSNNEEKMSPSALAIIIVIPVSTLTTVTVIIVYRTRRKNRFTECGKEDSAATTGETEPLNVIKLQNITTDKEGSIESLQVNVDKSIEHSKPEETGTKEANTNHQTSIERSHPSKNLSAITRTTVQQLQNYVREKTEESYREEFMKLDGLSGKMKSMLTNVWRYKTVIADSASDIPYATCKATGECELLVTYDFEVETSQDTSDLLPRTNTSTAIRLKVRMTRSGHQRLPRDHLRDQMTYPLYQKSFEGKIALEAEKRKHPAAKTDLIKQQTAFYSKMSLIKFSNT